MGEGNSPASPARRELFGMADATTAKMIRYPYPVAGGTAMRSNRRSMIAAGVAALIAGTILACQGETAEEDTPIIV